MNAVFKVALYISDSVVYVTKVNVLYTSLLLCFNKLLYLRIVFGYLILYIFFSIDIGNRCPVRKMSVVCKPVIDFSSVRIKIRDRCDKQCVIFIDVIKYVCYESIKSFSGSAYLVVVDYIVCTYLEDDDIRIVLAYIIAVFKSFKYSVSSRIFFNGISAVSAVSGILFKECTRGRIGISSVAP